MKCIARSKLHAHLYLLNQKRDQSEDGSLRPYQYQRLLNLIVLNPHLLSSHIQHHYFFVVYLKVYHYQYPYRLKYSYH